jgi:hypothetical protein
MAPCEPPGTQPGPAADDVIFDSTAVRTTELRTRLRILLSRDERTWGTREMRAALAVAGFKHVSGGDIDKVSLRLRTKALAETARTWWAAQDRAEEQLAVRAATEVASLRQKASEKFRARSRSTLSLRRSRPAAASMALGDGGSDTETSEDDAYSLSDDESRSQSSSSSYRASFRERSLAHTARARLMAMRERARSTSYTSRRPPPLVIPCDDDSCEEDAGEVRRPASADPASWVRASWVRAVLLPDFIPHDTPWRHVVETLLPKAVE